MDSKATLSARLLVTLTALLLMGCAQVAMLRPQPPLPKEVVAAANLLKRHDDAKAVAQLDAYLRQHPNDPVAYQAVVEQCGRLHRWDLVAHYAEQAAALSGFPTGARVVFYNAAGGAYLQLRQPGKALVAEQAAFRLDPHDSTTMNGLGYTLAEMPAGTADLNQALKLTTGAVAEARERGASDYDVAMYLDSVGWVLFKMLNYDEALLNLGRAADLLSQAQPFTPDVATGLPDVYYHLAMAYAAKNQLPAAFATVNRALKLDPHMAEALALKQDLEQKLPADERPGPPAEAAGPVR